MAELERIINIECKDDDGKLDEFVNDLIEEMCFYYRYDRIEVTISEDMGLMNLKTSYKGFKFGENIYDLRDYVNNLNGFIERIMDKIDTDYCNAIMNKYKIR